MKHNVASHVLLSCALAVAVGTGINSTEPLQLEAVTSTKYVKGVPIHNYLLGLHVKNNGSREAQIGAKWFVQAREHFAEQMRDICASTPLGTRHCHYVSENMPAFIFKGSEEELNMFLNVHSDIIEYVEPDMEISLADGIVPEFGGVEQKDPVWNLDRIDQRQGLSGSYAPGIEGGYGEGSHVYVLDTGVRTTHVEFEGRAIPTFDVTSGSMVVCNPNDRGCAADTHGHGTHCAGTVGSRTYGVAKNAILHACKVLNPSGALSWIVMGIDWVLSNGVRPAIISMSLGAPGVARAYNVAISAAVDKGIVVVVAAGNENDDACKYGPAFVPKAITVGSTTAPKGNKDPISDFSNFGTCVDIFAPGSSIGSCTNRNDNGMTYKSGTSMACPGVAGAAALVMAAYPGITAEDVDKKLKAHATRIDIVGQNNVAKPNSPGLLLYVGQEWTAGSNCPSGWFQVGKVGDDVPGWGLSRLGNKASSIQNCAGQCVADSRCGDFEYRPHTKDCALNDAAHSFPSSQTGSWPGSITCKKNDPDQLCPGGWSQVGNVGDDVPGWGMSRLGNKASSIDNCARQCVYDSRCGDFEYRPHTKDCALNDKAHANTQSQTGSWPGSITCKPRQICWIHLPGKYLGGYTSLGFKCYGEDAAKQLCMITPDCGGINKQFNQCGGSQWTVRSGKVGWTAAGYGPNNLESFAIDRDGTSCTLKKSFLSSDLIATGMGLPAPLTLGLAAGAFVIFVLMKWYRRAPVRGCTRELLLVST